MNLSADALTLERTARQYLKAKKILIIDHSAASREGLKSLFLDLGVEENQMISSVKFSDALETMKEHKPSIIISEFYVGEQSALELSTEMNSYLENRLEKLFMIVTTNASETAVAEAAEGDVDAYVLKPFSKNHLREHILKIIYPKLNPSEYVQLIEQGKRHLELKEWDEAEKCFKKAEPICESRSSLYYYLGKTNEGRGKLDEAFTCYEECLKESPLNFRCLNSKLEILEKQEKYPEAYGVAQVINAAFPMSPHRLGKVIQLAVFTQNFAEVQKLFDKFKKLEKPPISLKKMVSAALYVCGKFLVQKNMEESALRAFRDAIITGNSDPLVIEKSVTFLLEAGQKNTAEILFKLYPPERRHESHFQKLEKTLLAPLRKDS
jgi:CheY-like chemotaxis protein